MSKNHKTVISPGQGLILLIAHYKDDVDKVNRLKKLYLSGADNVSYYYLKFFGIDFFYLFTNAGFISINV